MSTLKADTIQNTSGGAVTLTKQDTAKAWCHWDESGTPAINGSFGVSTLTDEGTGQFKNTLSNAMVTNSYAVTFSTNVADAGGFDASTIGTTTAVTHQTRNQSGSDYDADVACMILVGDLA